MVVRLVHMHLYGIYARLVYSGSLQHAGRQVARTLDMFGFAWITVQVSVHRPPKTYGFFVLQHTDQEHEPKLITNRKEQRAERIICSTIKVRPSLVRPTPARWVDVDQV